MEPFSRQLKRAGVIVLIGLPALLAVDSIAAAHRFHETHRLPFDIAFFALATALALVLVPFRLQKRPS